MMVTVKKKSSKQKSFTKIRKKHLSEIDKARAVSWMEEDVTQNEVAR